MLESLVDPSHSRLRLLLEKTMNIMVGGYLCGVCASRLQGSAREGTAGVSFQLTRALEAQAVAGNFLQSEK